jgi:para-nitrobenzyl esterase
MDRRIFLKRAGVRGASLGLLPTLTFNSKPEQRSNTEIGIVASEKNAVVEIQSGKVRGYTRNDVYTFKGIPYARSTANEFRFMPPSKPEPWTGIRNTLVHGAACPQRPNKGWASEEYAFLFQWNDGHQDEDCLKLNVWTPGINDNKKRPVMFWIHGGAFFSGSSYEHLSNDGENLSRKGDVVVVSINHRLNVFGFLDLSAYGGQYESSGNVGMLDIVASLQWVRDNISNFGGDPDNVTIFGQSGGAAKVTTLMAMPSAKGLFHKAIAESSSTIRVATKDYAQQLATHVLEELRITSSNIQELHTLPFSMLVQAGVDGEKKFNGIIPKGVGRGGWQPVVDGKILPAHPFDPIVPEYSSGIPMIIGSNRNEWSASINDASLELLDEAGLKVRLREKYGDKSDAFYKVIRQVYPDVKPVEILSYLNPYNGMAFTQAERKVAQHGAPVYVYMFSWNTSVLDGRPRAYHCSEMPFVFYNTDKCETMTGGTEEARILSSKVSQAWINFARSGNPNHSALPHWPAFTKDKGEMMILNTVSEVKNDPDKLFRQAFESL